jgi:DNA-binding CsgD family transcriptional regulator/tetratricopeptide (TPR) repeat protein
MGKPAPSSLSGPAIELDLVGRSRELATIEEFLDDIERLPAGITLVGEPGIGKTTVWEWAIRAARTRGFTCLISRPALSEVNLAFAGLGDLLGDIYPLVVGRLPEPQRRALGAALLVEDDASTTPDQRTVGVATLSALQLLGAERPILLAIDDVQWLDATSVAIVGFALRRLTDEPIAVLLARRAGEANNSALSDGKARLHTDNIELAGLSMGALHTIVVERFGTVLPRPRLRRLHELSRGNPFLAIELVRAANDGRLRLDADEPIRADVDRLVGARLDGLPVTTRRALLAAATASRPNLELLAAVLGSDPEPLLEPAVSTGVLDVTGSEVRFSHPLLASAAYGAPPASERRAMHASLAPLVDDPEERARHLALAATLPDEAVAAEVEVVAQTVFRRGAPASAAQLVEMAVRLTPRDREDDRRRRAAVQAEYLFEAGDTASAAALLEPLIAATPPGAERAGLLGLLARIRHFGDDIESGVDLNRQALADSGSDDRLAAGIHEGLAWGYFLTRADLAEAARHARLSVKAARKVGDKVALAEALAAEGLTSLAIGEPSTDAIEQAMALEPALRHLRVLRHPSYPKAYALLCMDRLEEARAIFEELLTRAEDHGDESAVPSILVQLTMAEILAGRWDAAEEHAQVGFALAEQSAQRPARAALRGRHALLEALRGRLDPAEELAAESLALAGAGSDHDPDTLRRAFSRGGEIGAWAMGAAALAGGRYAKAHRYLEPLTDTLLGAGMAEPGELRFLPDAVEALLGLGRTDDAEALVAGMEARAERAGRATAAGTAARSRALVELRRGNLAAALEAAELAARLLDGASLPLELARSQIVLGDVQRRAQRKRAARDTLAAAIALLDGLGAAGWSARAREEVARIGGRASSASTLTAAESRVAELVSEGLANKEVAATLGIATKTVELHLSHIYAKLDVGSRTELVRQMATRPAANEAATGSKR